MQYRYEFRCIQNIYFFFENMTNVNLTSKNHRHAPSCFNQKAQAETDEVGSTADYLGEHVAQRSKIQQGTQ
jgi:hypothetical protein